MRRWWKLHYLTGTFYSTEEAEVDARKAELMSDDRQINLVSYKSSWEMPDDWEPGSALHDDQGEWWW